MPNDPVVVLCADAGYRVPLAVVVAGLAEHHISTALEIVVVSDGLAPDDTARIEGLAGPHRLRWASPDGELLAGTRLPAHLPTAALYRLLAPELVPSGTDRFVYLDADVVIAGDLGGLLDAPLGDAVLGAVQDAWIEVAGAPHGPPYAALGLAADAPYLNSGVLLVDVDRWRDAGVTARCLDVLSSHELPYADQCALNVVLDGRWAPLHPRWNLQTAHGTAAAHGTDPDQAVRVLEALADPAVVHYTGTKPWQRDGVVRAERWHEQVAATPYGEQVAADRATPAVAERAAGGDRPVAALLRRPEVRRLGRRAAGGAKALARRAGVEVRRAGAPPARIRVDPALVDLVVRHTGRRVAAGPFAGMALAEETSWGADRDLVPKLLGTYEQELAPVVEEVVAWRPDRVVNLGCADGYYAIGLARRLPDAEVVGIDIVAESLRIAERAAQANGVAASTRFVEGIDALPPAAAGLRTAWFVDIEGAEVDLFDPDPSRRPFADHDLLVVECHDFARPEATGVLWRAMAATHDIAIVHQGPRDPNAIPLLRDTPEPQRWIALSEGRPRPMHWAVLRPRAAPRVG